MREESMKILQNKKHFLFFSFLMLLQALSLPVFAVTIRHDVEDGKYLELGKKFPAVCALGRAGDGTLIAPQWILTAAHVASGLQRRGQGITARCGEAVYTVEKVFVHLQWTEMGAHDIALLKLSKAITGIAPVAIYFENDEENKIATIVGHGDTRTGKGGEWISDNRVRGATSKIDRADEKWIYLSFDEPPNGTELEGAPGRGDSGGPAFILKAGKTYVAGVSSLGTDGKNGPGTYGAEDSFVRVSQYKKWIDNVLAGKEKENRPAQIKNNPETSTNKLPPAKQNLPDTPESKIVAAYITAFNSGDAEKMRAFFAANLSEESAKRRPMDDRLQAYRQMYNNLGGMEFKKVLKTEKSLLAILVKRTKGEWQKFEFEFTAEKPAKLNGIGNQTADAQ